MDLKPISYDKIEQLIRKGVNIPNPLTIDVGDEVNIDQISGNGVKIYPGCRIYGEKTVISAGVQLGYEAPVTVENCQLGSKLELKGGYFKNPFFLKRRTWDSVDTFVRRACWKNRRTAHTALTETYHSVPFRHSWESYQFL